MAIGDGNAPSPIAISPEIFAAIHPRHVVGTNVSTG